MQIIFESREAKEREILNNSKYGNLEQKYTEALDYIDQATEAFRNNKFEYDDFFYGINRAISALKDISELGDRFDSYEELDDYLEAKRR